MQHVDGRLTGVGRGGSGPAYGRGGDALAKPSKQLHGIVSFKSFHICKGTALRSSESELTPHAQKRPGRDPNKRVPLFEGIV